MLTKHALTLANRLIGSENRTVRRGVHFALGLPVVGSALEELHYRVLDRAAPKHDLIGAGVPIPPARLRYSVVCTQGMLDVPSFVESGREHAARLRAAAT